MKTSHPNRLGSIRLAFSMPTIRPARPCSANWTKRWIAWRSASAQAEKETLEALKTFTRALSDDELEWLAAAGPGMPGGPVAGSAPNQPVDPKTLGKPKP